MWQTDVTHVPSFGHLGTVHVSVDTYSGMIYASAHSEETSARVISRFLKAFLTWAYQNMLKLIMALHM